MPEIAHTIDPSLAIGNQPADHLEKMHAVMADVLPMFELEDEMFDEIITDYVAKRVAELSSTASGKSVGNMNGGTDEYISPETPMDLSAMMSRPYYLDDNKAYEASFHDVRRFYRHYTKQLPPDTAYLNAVLQGANHGQARYFGSIVGNTAARMHITADILSDDDEDPENVSIADFKTTAMCQERAGVAHNTLQIFGLTSQLEAGHIGVKAEDGSVDSEPHAFLTVLSVKGERVIFDPTNPQLIKNEQGAITDIKAALYKMPDATATAHEGTLREFTLTPEGSEVSRSREVIYTFS